jgi:hypothetical protein
MTERLLLRAAYAALLMLPHAGVSRLKLQGALGAVRDEIARVEGRDSQDVQDTFETRAIFWRGITAARRSRQAN